MNSIKKMRMDAGLTQMDVAKAMDVGQPTVSCWETGASLPRAEQFPKLADLFGCTTDALYGRESKDTA